MAIHLSFVLPDGRLVNFSVDPYAKTNTLRDIAARLISPNHKWATFRFNGREMEDSYTLQSYGVKDGDLIALRPSLGAPYANTFGYSEPDTPFFYPPGETGIINPPQSQASQDVGHQREIEEAIRNQRVIDETLDLATEHFPESFSRVNMLYIEAFVNQIPVQAFVDTGAQTSIMSRSFAESCGLMHLVDKRFAGLAVGVGAQRIIGRLHAVDLQILDKFITCSFSVIEDTTHAIGMILGLDMMKRHRCVIDLNRDLMIIENGVIEVPFMRERDLLETPGPSSHHHHHHRIPHAVKISQASVNKLMQLGFSRERAEQALKLAGGNEEVAANILFGH